MRGAIAVSADLGGVDILSGAEALSLYKFNTGTAKHFFLLEMRHLYPSSKAI
jgi:hypothetical protein